MLDKLTIKEACVLTMNDAVIQILTIQCTVFALATMLFLVIYYKAQQVNAERLRDIQEQISTDGAAIIGMVGVRKNG